MDNSLKMRIRRTAERLTMLIDNNAPDEIIRGEVKLLTQLADSKPKAQSSNPSNN